MCSLSIKNKFSKMLGLAKTVLLITCVPRSDLYLIKRAILWTLIVFY